ncbi:hypothetical protein D3C87_1115650 [compost metagenome]
MTAVFYAQLFEQGRQTEVVGQRQPNWDNLVLYSHLGYFIRSLSHVQTNQVSDVTDGFLAFGEVEVEYVVGINADSFTLVSTDDYLAAGLFQFGIDIEGHEMRMAILEVEEEAVLTGFEFGDLFR